jgi:hypothetical protein
MGDVVVLTKVRRTPLRRRFARGELLGEIALFTGVRVERWAEEGRPDDPPPRDPRPPRRRRGG